MGNPFAKPSVVVTTPTPKTTTKPTTTPTTPTTTSTTPTIPTTIATTPEPTLLTTTATPARITAEGLITHVSITQLDSKSICNTPTTIMMSSVPSTPPLLAIPSAHGTPTPSPTSTSQSPFLLPVAIVMSTSFLIIALVLLVLVIRRRHHADKHVENSSNPVLTPAQVFSNSSFNAESSMECSSLNHIYVEHGERDSKLHDGAYTYVTKPSFIGGLPKGYAPSSKSPIRVFRGHPDGKSRPVQPKGFAQDAFGDEDHYNLLFEDRPSVVNVIVMNNYENHQPNDCHRNYANVTEIPESTTGFLEPPCATSEETVSIKSSLSLMKNQDSASQHDLRLSDYPPIESDNPTTNYDPNGSTRMLMSNDPEVVMGVQDDMLYENTPRSRGGSVKSVRDGEPKYYVLERQLKEGTDTNDDNGMVENMLYQSITE